MLLDLFNAYANAKANAVISIKINTHNPISIASNPCPLIKVFPYKSFKTVTHPNKCISFHNNLTGLFFLLALEVLTLLDSVDDTSTRVKVKLTSVIPEAGALIVVGLVVTFSPTENFVPLNEVFSVRDDE